MASVCNVLRVREHWRRAVEASVLAMLRGVLALCLLFQRGDANTAPERRRKSI